MNCPYCRAQNHADDHRCMRCGRRLDETSRPQVVHGNAAPALQPDIEVKEQPRYRPSLAVVPPPVAPAAEKQGPAMQASLFGPQIVAAESPAATRKQPVQSKSRQDRGYSLKERQAFFNFEATLQSEADAPCPDAPMAPTALRVISAGVDLTVALAGAGVFFATLHLSGKTEGFGPKAFLFYAAAVLSITLFYKLLFSMSGSDTPGMRWTGLRLVNFDGHIPTREQRLKRLAGGVISVLSLGLGLYWALFDEHKLTWHDQISNTFPTVR